MYILSDDVKNAGIQNAIIYDIETAPVTWDYNDLTENEMLSWKSICDKKIWPKTHSKDELKAATVFSESNSLYADEFQKSAGLYDEFNKIVCISLGMYAPDPESPENYIEKIVSYTNTKDETEEALLQKTSKAMLHYNNAIIVGFNSDGFDNPALVKKMIKYRITIPNQLKFWTKKVWTLQTFDIMKFWQQDKWGNSPSLMTTATYLGLDNPKEVLGGDKVGSTYYSNNDHISNVELIKKYCEADVKVTMQIWKHLKETNTI